MIQAASEEADQAHSGCVVTPTVAISPPELTGEDGTARVTAHFAGEGPVDVATAEPQAPTAQASMHRTREVSGLGVKPLCICSLPEAESKLLVGVVLRRQVNAREERNAARRMSNRHASQNPAERLASSSIMCWNCERS